MTNQHFWCLRNGLAAGNFWNRGSVLPTRKLTRIVRLSWWQRLLLWVGVLIGLKDCVWTTSLCQRLWIFVEKRKPASSFWYWRPLPFLLNMANLPQPFHQLSILHTTFHWNWLNLPFGIVFLGLTMVCCSALVAYAVEDIGEAAWWAIIVLSTTVALILLCVFVIYRQHQNTSFVTFKVCVFLQTRRISFTVTAHSQDQCISVRPPVLGQQQKVAVCEKWFDLFLQFLGSSCATCVNC